MLAVVAFVELVAVGVALALRTGASGWVKRGRKASAEALTPSSSDTSSDLSGRIS